eukprot:TRINITY_DN29246_c0_g1_i1.p1 TRINITY_DN29246_c0_g1~~TRINITY_DN29246_c0_g1_i1.p1  ORF type:complete len:438 (+),score=92.03 TRINITY_DN29246_c0_g1_i1:52-1365(+)
MIQRENSLVFDEPDCGSFMSVEGTGAMESTPREQVLCPSRSVIPQTPNKCGSFFGGFGKKAARCGGELFDDAGSPRKKQKSGMICSQEDDAPLFSSQEFFIISGRQESDMTLNRGDTMCTSLQLSHFHTNFKELRELGTGSFGRVVLTRHQHDGQYYAVKISLRQSRPMEYHNKLREARMLAKCVACPYIVRYFNSWVDDGYIHLQMEHCSEGSVHSILVSSGYARWRDSEVATLIMQMSMALDHLHKDLKIVHLDVKPENIYKTKRGVFKLGDFGLSAPDNTVERQPTLSQVGLSQGLSQMSFVSLEDGDARYVCIDMLNDKWHPKEADIFSLGLSIYEVVSSTRAPRSGTPEWAALRESGIPVASLAAHDYGYLHPLLSSMIDKEPTLRPSAESILSSNLELWRSIPVADGPVEVSVHPWVELQKILAEKSSPAL